MNKLFIVFLAVCLVSVHAFVKRDAPADNKNNLDLEAIQKELSENFETLGKKITEALDPKKLEKTVNEMLQGLQDAMKSAEKKEGAL